MSADQKIILSAKERLQLSQHFRNFPDPDKAFMLGAPDNPKSYNEVADEIEKNTSQGMRYIKMYANEAKDKNSSIADLLNRNAPEAINKSQRIKLAAYFTALADSSEITYRDPTLTAAGLAEEIKANSETAQKFLDLIVSGWEDSNKDECREAPPQTFDEYLNENYSSINLN